MTEEIQTGEETTLKTQPETKVVKEEVDESKTEPEKVEVEEESGGEEETPEKPQREARFVPYDKFKDVREENKTLKSEIEKLSQGKDSAGIDDVVEKMTEKYPESADFIKELTGAIKLEVAKSSKPAPEVEEAKRIIQEKQQNDGFEKDFLKLIKEIPEADDPKVKAKLKTLAFTEEFVKAPLKAIYYGNPDEFKSKKSAESSKGVQVDVSEMTFEEIDKLPDTEKAEAIKKMDMPTFEKFRERVRKGNNSFRNR